MPVVSSGQTGTRAKATDTSNQADQLRGVLVEAAHAQLAAVTGAIKFWAAWADSGERYASALTAELAKIEEGGDTSDVVARLSDLTREYLRSVTTLPSVAVDEFNRQLQTVGKPARKRARAARAKD